MSLFFKGISKSRKKQWEYGGGYATDVEKPEIMPVGGITVTEFKGSA